MLLATFGYHVWHPRVESFVRNAHNTPNEARYRQPIRADGYAMPGLRELDHSSISVWRWYDGQLIEQAQAS